MLMDDFDENLNVKLSLWIQCTVARCSLAFEVQNQGVSPNFSVDENFDKEPGYFQRKLCVELEDLTTSVDFQDIFSKVKLKLGSLFVNHYVNVR